MLFDVDGLEPTLNEHQVRGTDRRRRLDTLDGLPILIGGGVIGLELGSVYARLGAKVSVIEYMDSIIPTMDKGLGKELHKVLSKLGMEFYLGHKVTGATAKGKEVTVTFDAPNGDKKELKGVR